MKYYNPSSKCHVEFLCLIIRFDSLFQEVKAATAIPPTRQSKVLDMVNNFQRLQVT
jgi:hypothetical protein